MISARKIWCVLIASIFLIVTLFIPYHSIFYHSIIDDSYLLLLFSYFAWSSSIALFDILYIRADIYRVTYFKDALKYLLFGLLMNLLFMWAYFLYPISGLFFLTMAIYGGIKLFSKKQQQKD